jgi:hypothetical protein
MIIPATMPTMRVPTAVSRAREKEMPPPDRMDPELTCVELVCTPVEVLPEVDWFPDEELPLEPADEVLMKVTVPLMGTGMEGAILFPPTKV